MIESSHSRRNAICFPLWTDLTLTSSTGCFRIHRGSRWTRTKGIFDHATAKGSRGRLPGTNLETTVPGWLGAGSVKGAFAKERV